MFFKLIFQLSKNKRLYRYEWMSCEAVLKATIKTQKNDFLNLAQKDDIKNPDDVR